MTLPRYNAKMEVEQTVESLISRCFNVSFSVSLYFFRKKIKIFKSTRFSSKTLTIWKCQSKENRGLRHITLLHPWWRLLNAMLPYLIFFKFLHFIEMPCQLVPRQVMNIRWVCISKKAMKLNKLGIEESKSRRARLRFERFERFESAWHDFSTQVGDHRHLDGAALARFSNSFKSYMEDVSPHRCFVEVAKKSPNLIWIQISSLYFPQYLFHIIFQMSFDLLLFLESPCSWLSLPGQILYTSSVSLQSFSSFSLTLAHLEAVSLDTFRVLYLLPFATRRILVSGVSRWDDLSHCKR